MPQPRYVLIQGGTSGLITDTQSGMVVMILDWKKWEYSLRLQLKILNGELEAKWVGDILIFAGSRSNLKT